MSARPEEWLARRGGVRELLRVPASLFGALARARNGLYDAGLLPRARLAAPVVSVGNLSVGGTGKTPMVVWVARELERRGRRVGLLSRGYKASPGELNDEGRLMAELLPGVEHVQDADRVRGAGRLLRGGADVIVLDDGFQHRRLARDLDIVLVDATRPWGLPAVGGAAVRSVLPRGLLREGVSGLARADSLVLTRSDAVSSSELAELEEELERLAPGVPRALAEHRPSGLRRGQERLELGELDGRAVRLVSGIGNPGAFEATARSLGADVRGVHAFEDHHAYTREELEPLAARGDELLVTAKDAVKLAGLGVAHLVLDVELVVTRGEKVLAALLEALPPGEAEARRAAQHEGLHG